MSVRTSKKIPSISVPFVDQQGRISPVWHEFFRSFIAATVETGGGSGDNTGKNVIAGPGLREENNDGFPNNLVLGVGAGNAISVNANDVNVDIANQSYAAASLNDDVLISSEGTIKRTKVNDITNLMPTTTVGGSNTQMQYNNNGAFGGDTGFTTDGNGNVTLANSVNINGRILMTTVPSGGALANIYFDNVIPSATVPRLQSSGGGGYTFNAGQSGNNTGSLSFNSTGPTYVTWNFNSIAGSAIGMASGTGMQFTGLMPVRRVMENNLIASTSQTQGNGALTGDYNNVTTVANANDTVTLPAALSGRYCVVRNAGANVMQVFPASGANLGQGTNISTTISAGQFSAWVAINTTTWFQTVGPIRQTVTAGITASTTQTQGQQPLTADVNEISVVANLNDTVTLPPAEATSRTITIINNGANILKIFPASGDDLGTGINTSTTLLAGANVRYTNYNVTNWEAV